MTVSDRVKEILKTYPKTRNDDFYLMLKYYEVQHGVS